MLNIRFRETVSNLKQILRQMYLLRKHFKHIYISYLIKLHFEARLKGLHFIIYLYVAESPSRLPWVLPQDERGWEEEAGGQRERKTGKHGQ